MGSLPANLKAAIMSIVGSDCNLGPSDKPLGNVQVGYLTLSPNGTTHPRAESTIFRLDTVALAFSQVRN